jgi:hypothetical protein
MEQIVKNKYHGGKIYTLRSPSTDKIYIGSTTQSLARRKALHKCVKSNDISKLEDFYIELLENFKCENRDELNKREGELIRLNKDKCCNKQIAGRTDKESMKAYRENNKEKILKKQNEYRDNNKEKIKESKKEYYENNKEKIKESNKEYYEKNKKNII